MCCALRGHFEDMVFDMCLEVAHDMAILERVLCCLHDNTLTPTPVLYLGAT